VGADGRPRDAAERARAAVVAQRDRIIRLVAMLVGIALVVTCWDSLGLSG
jgi:hypothetical protein